MSIRGQCHCGRVAFTVRAPFGVIYCHCKDCQQMHGNFNAMAAVDRDGLSFSGDESLHWYESSDKARRGFCSQCGSRLFKDNDGSPKMMVSMGSIEDTGLRGFKNIWKESKGDWYELPATPDAPEE